MRRHNRLNVARALMLADIESADRGPNVSDDIMLTYSLGDLSGLLPPLPVGTAYFMQGGGAIAAVYRGIDLRPPPDSAIYVKFLRNGHATDSQYWALGDLLDGNIAAAAPDFVTGIDATRCIIRTGTRTALPAGRLNLGFGTQVDDAIVPIRVDPGSSLLVIGDTVNEAFLNIMVWDETPTIPATR